MFLNECKKEEKGELGKAGYWNLNSLLSIGKACHRGKSMYSGILSSKRLLVLGLILMFMAGSSQAIHSGVGGNANDQGDVAIAGCTCHAPESDNSVTVILDYVPYHYAYEESYPMKIQLIGGPDIEIGGQTGGFSIRVSSGTLTAGEGYENLVQNWEGDETTLTHTSSGSTVEDRSWHLIWTSPSESSGENTVSFWLAGNSVNGDQIPSALDRWNRLSINLEEGEDNGKTRTIFSGNGDINPPSPIEQEVDLHHMGAKLRAHWLGLLGFGAVILVIGFCGLFLRYGFSRHYVGRSNLLKLRIKHLRRGDQL